MKMTQKWQVRWTEIPINSISARHHSKRHKVDYLDAESALQRFFSLCHSASLFYKSPESRKWQFKMSRAIDEFGVVSIDTFDDENDEE